MTIRERILAPFWAVRLAFCRAVCRRRGHVPYTHHVALIGVRPEWATPGLVWCRRCGRLPRDW